jgi:CheY-like chemotaxis protein
MIEFQCLYLEDDDDDFDTFKQIFERAMRPYKLIIDRAKNPTEAFQKLDARGDEIEILFADLLMPDSTGGLNVVEDAARNYPDILIIGVSKAGGSDPGAVDEFKRRAGEVSWLFDKRLLKGDDYSFERIREEIISVAIDKGFDLSEGEEVKVEWEPGIPGKEKLDAEIDSIGIGHLRKILGMIDTESEVFTPYYLTPGFSGASVLRVKGTNAAGKHPRNLIVKFSHDRSKLEKELLGAPREGQLSSDIYVPYIREEEELWEYDGIYAIAARFEDDAITLEEWLNDPTINPKDTVEDVFNELFIQGLGKAYSEGNDLVSVPAMELLAPSIRTRARILIGLDLIESLLPDINIDINLKLVRDFVRLNGQIKTHPAAVYPRGTYTCWSHGDLHTRNILIGISARSRPRLIDTANRAEQHWASDPARLCADLWITNWDRKPKSYFWDQLNTWREQIRLWLNNGDIPLEGGSPNRRVFEALAWVRDNLTNLFDLSKVELAKWQYDLALALEFLSMSAYPDVPMPKRCLGVLAANDILTELDDAVPWL